MIVVLANATLQVDDEGAVNEPPCKEVPISFNVIVRMTVCRPHSGNAQLVKIFQVAKY